jgi:hypothetical protein
MQKRVDATPGDVALEHEAREGGELRVRRQSVLGKVDERVKNVIAACFENLGAVMGEKLLERLKG